MNYYHWWTCYRSSHLNFFKNIFIHEFCLLDFRNSSDKAVLNRKFKTGRELLREYSAFIYKFKVNPGQIWVFFFLNGKNCPRLFLPKSGAIVEKIYHLLGFQGCCWMEWGGGGGGEREKEREREKEGGGRWKMKYIMQLCGDRHEIYELMKQGLLSNLWMVKHCSKQFRTQGTDSNTWHWDRDRKVTELDKLITWHVGLSSEQLCCLGLPW